MDRCYLYLYFLFLFVFFICVCAGEYQGISDVLLKIIKSSGVRGLYRGLGPSVLGIIPYAGIDLMVS